MKITTGQIIITMHLLKPLENHKGYTAALVPVILETLFKLNPMNPAIGYEIGYGLGAFPAEKAEDK